MRLSGVGTWMTTNGAAISGAGYTGLVAQPAWGAVTRKGNKLYLVVNNWASTLHLSQRSPFTVTGARVLGSASPVSVRAAGDGYDFLPSGGATNAIATVIEADISTPAPAAVGTGSGLKAEFWNNTTFPGTPAVTRTDPTVNYAWRFSGSPAASIGTDNFSGRWTGSIEPRYSERYTFTAVSDDTVRLWIDGQLVIDNATPHGPAVDQGSVTLAAGRHDIRLEQTEQGGEAYLKLIWSSPNTPAQIVPRSQLYPSCRRGPAVQRQRGHLQQRLVGQQRPRSRRLQRRRALHDHQRRVVHATRSPAPASTTCRSATPTRAWWTSTSTVSSRPRWTPPAASA